RPRHPALLDGADRPDTHPSQTGQLTLGETGAHPPVPQRLAERPGVHSMTLPCLLVSCRQLPPIVTRTCLLVTPRHPSGPISAGQSACSITFRAHSPVQTASSPRASHPQ